MEDEQFKNLQRSINEATEHAQGERDLETTRVEGNSPASGVAKSYAAAQELKEIVQAAHSRRHDPNPDANVNRLDELPMTEEEYDRFRELLEAA